MSIAPTRESSAVQAPEPPEVLIKEARQRGRRILLLGLAACTLGAGLAVAAVVEFGASAPTGVVHTSPAGGVPIPTGAAATAQRLGRGSSIWVVDMVSRTHGFAIAGRPGHGRPAYLVATTSGGRTWLVRSRVPYSLTGDGYSVPSLQFLNDRDGYTQSGIASGSATSAASDRDVFVTTDGGVTWRPLSFAGVTPTAAGDDLTAGSVNESYQVAGGVVSLVALQCTGAALVQGGSVCPSALERFRVGATHPFETSRIPSIGDPLSGGRVPSDRLLAAVNAATVIVAQGDLEGWSPVLISRNGGRTWSAWPTPCGSLRVGKLDLQLPIQELHVFAPQRWVLDCFQGGGMSQGSIVVSVTSDQGASWRLLSEGSEGATAGGIPYVGTIGDADQTLWASNDGRVLWAWNSTQGWLSASTDGGRDWKLLGPLGPGDGGPPTVDLAPVGPRGAILVVLGRAFATTDGTHWHHVRLLPVS